MRLTDDKEMAQYGVLNGKVYEGLAPGGEGMDGVHVCTDTHGYM